MDSDLEELESLYSEHFGRTPCTTPHGSQCLESGQSEESDESDTENDLVVSSQDLDGCAHRFIDACGELENRENEDTEGDDEIENVVEPDSDPDLAKISQFKENGCGCLKKCDTKFEETMIYKHILDIREMEKSDKDMYIMATLAGVSSGEETKRGKKRQRFRHDFIFSGVRVCRKMFMLVFDIGKCSLQNIMTHVNENGPIPRIHGNTGRKPANSLVFDDIRTAIQFISNYSDEFGMPQPAAPRGQDNTAPIYLSSETTKKEIHRKYTESCLTSDPAKRAIKYSTFNKIWATCLSHIKIATPRDDVCATCDKSRKEIMHAVSEEEKLIATTKMKEHIVSAQKERDVYNDCLKRAKESLRNLDNNENKFVHYTFDFCQNVSIPHHARQMGPLYFATLRKIQIFGFRIDGIPKQLNFMIDENETIGKDGTSTHGPNAVISMVDYALQTYGSGEFSCAIHADNCCGQNKNQYLLGYFMWRVMTGKHKSIEYMMQIPGYARCLIDGGFALLKKLYRRSDCDSIDQLHNVVDKSSSTNIPVRYPVWQWRDWKNFLGPIFRPVRGIRQYQYFRMSSDEPGVVKMKKTRDSEETSYQMLRTIGFTFDDEMAADIIQPSGLSYERQQYLHRYVRPFVRPNCQDATCPPPVQN